MKKKASCYTELENEGKTDGEWRKWKGLRVCLYCPRTCNRGSAVAVWKIKKTQQKNTGGCKYTLGPVLNAGGVVQSQNSC